MVLAGTGGALPAGLAGPAGPSGAGGAEGPAGPPGQPATVRQLLATFFAADRQSARAGRRLSLRYVSTMPAVVTVELRRGTSVIRRLSAAAVAGRNVLSASPGATGALRVGATAVTGDQRVTDSARLTVLRRRT